jgi:hypothetical protein
MLDPTQLSQPSHAKREFYVRCKVQFAGVQVAPAETALFCERFRQFLGSQEKMTWSNRKTCA